MTDKQIIKAARKKLNGCFPTQLNVFYYKGVKITRNMYFGYDVREGK